MQGRRAGLSVTLHLHAWAHFIQRKRSASSIQEVKNISVLSTINVVEVMKNKLTADCEEGF